MTKTMVSKQSTTLTHVWSAGGGLVIVIYLEFVICDLAISQTFEICSSLSVGDE